MSAAAAAAAAAALLGKSNYRNVVSTNNYGEGFAPTNVLPGQQPPSPPLALSRYESQKRRDWNTFGQYLRNHRPPLALSRCSGAHVLEFLRYLDQFGKTKVHNEVCPFFGHPHPPAPCACPLRQAWGSLDALVGRLRAAFEENGGSPDMNPFGARAVRLYLREVRDSQSKARGIAYEKKKRKKQPPTMIPSNNGSSNDNESHQNNYKNHYEVSESGMMNHHNQQQQQMIMVMGRQVMDPGSCPTLWSHVV